MGSCAKSNLRSCLRWLSMPSCVPTGTTADTRCASPALCASARTSCQPGSIRLRTWKPSTRASTDVTRQASVSRRWRPGKSGAACNDPCTARIASVIMPVFVPGTDGDDAAVGHFAGGVLELDGGVMNVEARRQFVANQAQQAFALGGAHVGDADMARERVGVAADAPDVQIVDAVDARYGTDAGLDALQLHAAGNAFEQDVQALANDSD